MDKSSNLDLMAACKKKNRFFFFLKNISEKFCEEE